MPLLIPQVSRGLAVGDLFHAAPRHRRRKPRRRPHDPEPKTNPSNHWVSFALEGIPTTASRSTRASASPPAPSNRSRKSAAAAAISPKTICACTSASGSARTIDKVEVIWPNGPTQTFTNVQPNHFYSLKQNGTLVLSDAPAHPQH